MIITECEPTCETCTESECTKCKAETPNQDRGDPRKCKCKYVMPNSHLASVGSTEPVSCPYPPFRADSVLRQKATLSFSYGFTRRLRFYLARGYANLKIIVSP